MPMTATEKLLYHILHLVTAALGRCSYGTGVRLSGILGSAWMTLDGKHRRIVLDNLSFAYAGRMNRRQIRRLARRVFDHTIRMLFEYAWFYSKTSGFRSDRIIVRGLPHLENAHKKNRGVLLLSGHIGNWEVAAALAPITGLPASVVYRKIDSVPVDRFVFENRKSLGLKLYPLHNAFDAIFGALKNGELVGLLMDQNTGHARGVFIDFFGRKACANPGLVKLALQTGAPVVPVFNYREKDRIIIEIQPELPIFRTGNREKDILVNTQYQHDVIETIIRRYPDQWFWVHNRWKNQPLDEHRG